MGGEGAPVVDHAGVVVEALVEPAPVVAHQVKVKVVGGDRGFPVAHLLEGPLTEEEGGGTCSTLQPLRISQTRCLSHQASGPPKSGDPKMIKLAEA